MCQASKKIPRVKHCGIAAVLCLLILLISCGGSLDKEGLQKNLSDAARSGNISRMQKLIGLGAIVNDTCCGKLPALHAAAANGQIEAARYLLSHGADIDFKYKFLMTPLMEAARNNHVEVVRLLLEHGADPNAVEAMEHQSALDYASGNEEITTLLKKYGAKDRALNSRPSN